MQAKFLFTIMCLGMSVLACPQRGFAQELKSIMLPVPQTQGGKPLMEVLSQRKSVREFSSKEIPLQVLSDLLWAACGINRPDSGKRTAPTARNMQEIDVYVAKADGLYLYDAKENTLLPIIAGDLRALTGKQEFVSQAPINLIYVGDFSKMKGETSDMEFYSAVDTGYISENVYLYCASEGLATVVRGLVDKTALAKAMKLRPEQKIILAQTVGYPN
ncbi:MAG: nitroreductase [Omnitrophica WOR_2 bacterium RBG_13_44_8b]|nr:MAG: nitroreductase [Omnitrophica WOR_2 bacterium RBG_13_44_8b]